MHFMYLLYVAGSLASFVLAQDVYTAHDNRILCGTFPVKFCLAVDIDKSYWLDAKA